MQATSYGMGQSRFGCGTAKGNVTTAMSMLRQKLKLSFQAGLAWGSRAASVKKKCGRLHPQMAVPGSADHPRGNGPTVSTDQVWQPGRVSQGARHLPRWPVTAATV